MCFVFGGGIRGVVLQQRGSIGAAPRAHAQLGPRQKIMKIVVFGVFSIVFGRLKLPETS